ncbi:alpha/beta hydrolase [Planococcus shenhongbingii]|uniref:alpha/beta fold hydrolase n=1 Tax=Planococcus shenhongbingii TaxID=3058398 RepID=UPI00261A2A56|nr:alpha/beta hydrolase [Planococcus sp. N016]WKA58352.1 alpha/beta hydrolase [Planococcus sp. N016]
MGHYVEVESGVKVYVEDVGIGQPIVFIHGWPLNSKAFEMQISELALHGFRFIGIDLRGYGKSDKPWAGYDYSTQASDVKAVVDHLGLENIVLAGFSMGGPIAIRYLTKYGEHGVDKLLLMGAAAPLFTQRDDFKIGLRPAEVDDIISQVKKDRPAFLALFANMFFEKKKSDEFLDWFKSLGLEAAAHSTINSAIALRDEDLRDELAGISLPTAIFHGQKDQICRYELGEELEKQIPNSVLVPFKYSGHGINGDEPDRFNEEMIRFLKSSGVKRAE